MPKYEVTSPDGKKFEVNAPEGASQEDVLAYAKSQWKAPADKAEKGVGTRATELVGAGSSGVNRGVLSRAGLPFNPVDVMANVLDLGKAAIGAPYIAISGNDPPSWLIPQDRSKVVGSGEYLIDKARQTSLGRAMLDAPNPEDEGGYIQTMGMGAGSGGRSGAMNGALSAAAGKAVGDATGNQALAIAASMAPTAAKMGATELARRVATPQDPRRAELARRAVNDYGIPLGVADITDSRFIKSARSAFNDTPGLSMIGDRQDAPKQGAFNRAVGRQFGADDTELSPGVMSNAKAEMGSKFNRVWNGNNLQVDGTLMQQLMDLRNSAAQLPQGDRSRLNNWVDDVLGQMRPGPNNVPTIPGEVVNKYQSKLRALVDSAPDGFVKNDLNDLRQGLIGGFNRSVSGPDAGLLREAREQYKAFKTVEPLLNKSDAGVAGRLSGDVPPGLLPGAVNKAYSDPSTTGLGELSQIGSQFLTDRVKQTGGSSRAMIQNGVVGGGLLGAAGVASPVAAAAGAGTAGLLQWAIGNPRLARSLLNSGQLTPEQIQVLANVPGLLEEKK